MSPKKSRQDKIGDKQLMSPKNSNLYKIGDIQSSVFNKQNHKGGDTMFTHAILKIDEIETTKQPINELSHRDCPPPVLFELV